MHEFSFNLVEDAWLPCVRKSGASNLLNLRDVFAQAYHLNAISGDSPPVTVAIHRFLLAILHRVFGPGDEYEWAKLWQADSLEMTAINAYLDRWKPRFDLFDPVTPFYQAPDKRVKSKSVISLSPDRASGNNPTLFDHHTEGGGEELTPAQAARVLITAQAFGLAGLSGIKQKFTDGTCASGIIFLVQGDDLKQTLLLNMLQYPPGNDQFGIHTEKDMPAWEMEDPFVPDRASPFGYLDYLTWQNRRILFKPERTSHGTVVRKMTMAPALRYDTSLLDPMKNYRIDEREGHLVTHFNEKRVFWRDSASLFGFDENWLRRARPPATFAWLRELVDEGLLEQHGRFRTLALGMSKKQAKVFFYRQEQLPMPLDYLTQPRLVISLDEALRRAGTTAFDLIQSARLLGMHLRLSDPDRKKWGEVNSNAKRAIDAWVEHTGMERNYWASLDVPFQSFIVNLALDEEQALIEWRAQLRRSARDASELAAESAGSSPRAYKGVVRAQSYLRYRLNKLLPEKEKIE